jgi:putative sterol carrier protein
VACERWRVFTGKKEEKEAALKQPPRTVARRTPLETAENERKPLPTQQFMPPYQNVDVETAKEEVKPLPSSILVSNQVKSYASKFKPNEAKGWNRTLQIHITGPEGGIWHFIIRNQKCEVRDGELPMANLKLTTDVATWKSVSEGKTSGTSAFMSGKLKVQGPMADLIRAGKVFPGLF